MLAILIDGLLRDIDKSQALDHFTVPSPTHLGTVYLYLYLRYTK